MTPAEQIAAARERNRRERQEWEDKQRRMEEECAVLDVIVARDVLPNLRRASADDYNRWLVGHLESGGKVTHAYDYPLPCRNWHVALRDVILPPLFGSHSLNIIIPRGVTVICEDPGHSGLYWMDGFRKGIDGQHFTVTVPVFSDTRV